jgi:hypothetical protein
MSENIEDLSIQWVEEDGTIAVKEVDKFVLSKGSWTTIMFLYQDRDRRTGEYSASKVRIVRYQKRGGRYMPQSKFNISSGKQARKIIEILSKWFPDDE